MHDIELALNAKAETEMGMAGVAQKRDLHERGNFPDFSTERNFLARL